jgi:hypothetical protein
VAHDEDEIDPRLAALRALLVEDGPEDGPEDGAENGAAGTPTVDAAAENE